MENMKAMIFAAGVGNPPEAFDGHDAESTCPGGRKTLVGDIDS